MDKYRDFEIKDFLNDENFIDWVLTPTQSNDLFWHEWLIQNPGQAGNVERARAILKSIYILPLKQRLTSEGVDAIADQFHKQTQPRTQKLWFTYWPHIAAAAAILLITVSTIFYFGHEKSTVKEAHFSSLKKVVNDTRSVRIIKLYDNSLVILQPHSTLIFPKEFKTKSRTVSLTGAAFFEVRADAEHPFVVNADDITVKVLGTSFDIVSSKKGQNNSVVVKTGKVQVLYGQHKEVFAKQGDSITLMSNQKVVFNSGTPKSEIVTTIKPQLLSPAKADKVFSFDNAPLGKIISSLQEAYHVEIVYDKKEYEGYTVTASLSKLPLEEKVRAICKAIGANYRFEENKIRIY